MENEMMMQVLVFTTLISPIVTVLIQVIKPSVKLPNNLLPVLSLLVGMLIGFLSYPFTDMDYVLRIWAGAFAGLSGTGLYEALIKRDGTTK